MPAEPDRLQPVVAVPARKEEWHLPKLLAVLAAQAGPGRGGCLRAAVVLNGCTDGSARAAPVATVAVPALDLDLIDATPAADAPDELDAAATVPAGSAAARLAARIPRREGEPRAA